MTRKRFSSGFARANRRLTAWSLGPGGDDLVTLDRETISVSDVTILGSGITPVIPNLTIIRIHGFMTIQLATAGTALGGYNWAAGIGIFTLDAFSIGDTAVPHPFLDIDWPGWMWHGMGGIRTVLGALAIGDPSVNPVTVPIESKSMRKLRLNEVFGLVFESGEAGTSVIQVEAATRVLVKLP